METKLQVSFSDPHLTIETIRTKLVNQPRAESSLWGSFFVCVVSLVVNIAAVVVIGKKEKTGANHLIILDSFANILTAMVQTFNSMILSNPLFTTSKGNAIACILNMSGFYTLGIWNRLVPVGLAFHRYLLVSKLI